MRRIAEYDLHRRGMTTEDALSELERLVSRARTHSPCLMIVMTGYGSSGGTSLIKEAVLRRCATLMRLNHIRGYLDGEYAGDLFAPQARSFPCAAELPSFYRCCPNPGTVIIAV